MYFTNKRILLHGLTLLVTFNIAAQNILSERDSLPIVKPRALKSTYNINHPGLHEISVKTKDPKAVGELPKKFWDNLAGGIVTLVSGINTATSVETLWVMHNELISTTGVNTWQIPLFFPGEYSKTRERVKNDDGSTSVDTQKGVYVDWSKGAYGLILENGDTLGSFDLSTNLHEDSESFYWLNRLEDDNNGLKEKLKKYKIGPINYNFRITGIIRKKSFYMVTNGNHFRSVIITEGEPTAIFQCDPNFIILSKKDRISPYLLFANQTGEEERADLIRLALLSPLLSKCVNVNFYDK